MLIVAIPGKPGKQTLYKASHPVSACWMVAHNGKDCAHILELGPAHECLTGLGALEQFASEKDAQTRAIALGWNPPTEEGLRTT